ncbi:hypothetical protein ACFL6U_02485 [Planctomycetota bacterium]
MTQAEIARSVRPTVGPPSNPMSLQQVFDPLGGVKPGQELPYPFCQLYEAIRNEPIARVQSLWEGETGAQIRQGGSDCSLSLWIEACVQRCLGHSVEAEALYCRILEWELHPAVYHALAGLCRANPSRQTEAMRFSRLAHERAPRNAWLCSFLGRDLIHAGVFDEGMTFLSEAVRLDRDQPYLPLNVLWYKQYHVDTDRDILYQGYRDWAQRFAPAPTDALRMEIGPQGPRPLRVGYLSPEFRRHSTTYTFEPVLDAHDRDRFVLFGYGNVLGPDHVTERLSGKFHVYHDIYGWDMGRVVRQMQADRIDVLVPLVGYCTDNRMDVVFQRPAPVQVGMGCIHTTGLTQLDYRVTDEITDPPGSEQYYVERQAIMPHGMYCFRPPEQSPQVGPLPALTNGYITFGSFNSHIKLNDYALALWARVMQQIPSARLVLKFPSADDPDLRCQFQTKFEQWGISVQRLDFVGESPYYEHLEQMGQVDMALDAFPFNGAATTFEGLWMGVPILTLCGETCPARSGRDLLTRVGLDPFVALSPNEYVAKALAFAQQLDSLATIRRGLRQTVLKSPLCDAHLLTESLETLYRDAYQHRLSTSVVGGSLSDRGERN